APTFTPYRRHQPDIVYMMLTVVISTMGRGIDRLHEVIAIQHPAIRYLVVQQTKTGGELPTYLQLRKDVAVIQSATRRLSRSRNIGLKHCRTTYALIADDDVSLIPEGMQKMLDIIKHDRPDFALFKIQTHAGEPA